MKSGTIQYDKYFLPIGSPIQPGSGSAPQKMVAWEFGINQKIQAKKIVASTGAFKNLTGGTNTNQIINTGTINTSLFQTGTIQTSVFSGTISQPVSTGGTFTNPTINTGTINTSLMTGTLNSGVIGTPSIIGGTWTSGSLGGTASYLVASGTASLGTDNNWAFQTKGGSAILVIRSGGTNFFFNPAGTF